MPYEYKLIYCMEETKRTQHTTSVDIHISTRERDNIEIYAHYVVKNVVSKTNFRRT